MTGHDDALVETVSGEPVATTNLWYVRLCKSAARVTGGALLASWAKADRRALVAGLVALPDDVAIAPMRELAWRMGELIADFRGLSTLGAEAVAAALVLNGRVLVSARDDGPGIRSCCEALGVEYEALAR